MKKRVLIAPGLALVMVVTGALQALGAETTIWQIGQFDYNRNELAGSGLTGIYTFDFYEGTTPAEQFPGTLEWQSPWEYDYRSVHLVNIHFQIDGPYIDVNFVYGRGGDEVDSIKLDGGFLAQVAGTENSWEGSPYTMPIAALSSGSHVISIEVVGNTTLDDAHVIDALKLTGHPLRVEWLPPLALDDWTLNENATLPIKFQLYKDGILYCTPLDVTLQVTGYSALQPRFDSDGCYYIANFRPDIPGSGLAASVYTSGIELGVSRHFDILEAGTPNGRGRSGN